MADIWVRGLTKKYGHKVAVDRLDLDVEDGEFIVLLGPSGCGKTTTLRMLAGLEVPDAGEIVMGNTLMAAPGRKVFVPPERRDIGMVFQSYALWPHMDVFANVAYPLRSRRAKRAEIRHRVDEVLRLVGLADLSKNPVSALSGGQQQRVSFARAIAAKPGLLLFDEPLSNLDAKLRLSMRNDLRRLHDELGTTSVYVTHDQIEALALADRIVVMANGRIEQLGTPQEIFDHPRNEFVADFVGYDNVIRGVVTGGGSESRTVSVVGTDDELHVAKTFQSALGESVTLAFRSSSVTLCEHEATPSANVFNGSIRQVSYLGEVIQLQVDMLGISVSVSVPVGARNGGRARREIGECVIVHVPPERLVPLQPSLAREAVPEVTVY